MKKIEDMTGATFSECGKYRYALWRIWDESKPLVLFIMLNPSTADARENDATIRRCISFAKGWGYGGIYVGNLFAYRSTDPERLYYENRRGLVDIVGKENDKILSELASLCKDIIFAWGNDGGLRGRSGDMIELFPDAKCLRLTKVGHPGHPLFIKGDVKPVPYSLAISSTTVKDK